MFDLINDPLKELREFASLHDQSLQNASLLLGGQPALRSTQALLDDISSSPTLSRRLSRQLVTLHQLLTLHNVHDPERVEAAYFAEIDPASPIVEDICLLSEALTDVIYRLNNDDLIRDIEPTLAA